MNKFPDLEIPDIYKMAQSNKWDPRKYQPMVYNAKIKKLADTLKPGTLAYDDFWDEMDYYCYMGYQPKDMPRISGRHFYYLNMCKIKLLPPGKKNKVLSNPYYRDLDHWLFLEIEAALKHGYGLIIGKPRQVGLSEVGAVNCNYQGTFGYLSEIGICAGKDSKVTEFRQKLESSLKNTHPAYRNGTITNNSDELKKGYEDTINRQKEEFGIQSIYRFKTMFADSGNFEGVNNNKLVIYEEAGLFENITASFKATEPTFKSGNIQYGSPLVYGTGGEIEKGAKGYKEMWDNHEAYNLKKLFIPAYYFYPGEGKINERTKKKVSFFDHKKGVTNRKAAKEYIIEERKIAAKSKETYVKHVQMYPLTESEIFLKTKGGILDLAKLNFQVKEINEGNSPTPVMQGRLEWIDSVETTRLLQRAKNKKEKTKIRIANDSKVKFVLDDDGSMFKQGNPINQNVHNLNYKPDIGGCDSYDEEVDEKNKENVSAGAIMAYRCFSGPSRDFNYPVGVLTKRGDGSFDDDEFYEESVMFAIYWDIEVLIEHTKYHITRYFYDVGAHRYVRSKPYIEEAGTQRHANTDGVKMTGPVKIVLKKMLKSEVKDNIHKCFILKIILDLIKFGDGNTDIAMAYGICLLHRMDIFEEITEGIEDGNNTYDDQEAPDYDYYVDSSGNLRIDTYGDQNAHIETFIPERDLNKRDYESYMEERKVREEKVLEKQNEYQKKAKELGVDETILKMVMNEQDFRRENDN